MGASQAGKTSLITRFLRNKFVGKDTDFTVLDVFKGIKKVQGVKVHLEINDTGGQEEYQKRNREVAYQGADVFIICVPTC